MVPGSPSCTTIGLVLLGPAALLVVGMSWRVPGLWTRLLLPDAGASTSAMNTCDGVLVASLPMRVVVLLHVEDPLERSRAVWGLALGVWLRLSGGLTARVASAAVVAAGADVGARVSLMRRRVPQWLM